MTVETPGRHLHPDGRIQSAAEVFIRPGAVGCQDGDRMPQCAQSVGQIQCVVFEAAGPVGWKCPDDEQYWKHIRS
jgi:hypothetical protein